MKKYNILSQEVFSKLKFPVPYFYGIANSNQQLYSIGTRHSYDPNDPQFVFIQKKWKEFLDKTGNNRVVIVESSIRPNFTNLEQAVRNSSEGGFISHLAQLSGVEVQCAEPVKDYEILELEKSFSKNEIVYYHFARSVSQYIRKHSSETELGMRKFENYVKPFLIKYMKEFKWADFDFSLENMYKIHKEVFGVEFDLTDKNFLIKIPWPVFYESVINQVSRESGRIRDNWIVGKIETLWKQGNSLFIVQGSSHAVIQERAIRQFTFD